MHWSINENFLGISIIQAENCIQEFHCYAAASQFHYFNGFAICTELQQWPNYGKESRKSIVLCSLKTIIWPSPLSLFFRYLLPPTCQQYNKRVVRVGAISKSHLISDQPRSHIFVVRREMFDQRLFKIALTLESMYRKCIVIKLAALQHCQSLDHWHSFQASDDRWILWSMIHNHMPPPHSC